MERNHRHGCGRGAYFLGLTIRGCSEKNTNIIKVQIKNIINYGLNNLAMHNKYPTVDIKITFCKSHNIHHRSR